MNNTNKLPVFDVSKRYEGLVKKYAKWDLSEKRYKKQAERLAKELITLKYFYALNTEKALANYFFEKKKKQEEKNLKRGFSSSSLELTVLLVYHLIKNAKKEVKIFTCCFSSDPIFKDSRIQEAINNAVARGVKFQFLFEKNDDQCCLPYSLKTIRILKKGSKLKNHFMISDKHGFRIELKKDGNIRRRYHSVKSETSFNCPEVVKGLNEIFSKYYKNNTIKS